MAFEIEVNITNTEAYKKLKDINVHFLNSRTREVQSRVNYETACENRGKIKQSFESFKVEYVRLQETFEGAWGNLLALERLGWDSWMELRAAKEQYVISREIYIKAREIFDECRERMYVSLSDGPLILNSEYHKLYALSREPYMASRFAYFKAEERYNAAMHQHIQLVEQHRVQSLQYGTLFEEYETNFNKYAEFQKQYTASKDQCRYLKKIRRADHNASKKLWKLLVGQIKVVQKGGKEQANFPQSNPHSEKLQLGDEKFNCYNYSV